MAATNVDMIDAVHRGKFREDLYYRLSTVQIVIPPLRDRSNDILLLARKFAADFSERYRTPRITLDESASRLLLHYNWPGNVRQLKNVIEQLSLFQAGNEVNADILSPYLPDMVDNFAPVAANTVASGAYDRERDMLFNLIFRLQREIDELRSRLDNSQQHMPGQATLTPHLDMSDNMDVPNRQPLSTSLIKYGDDHHHLIDFTPAVETQSGNTPDIASTLEDTERETIRKALERNMGRRRNAAAELNISERTLYRKIKEYNLE